MPAYFSEIRKLEKQYREQIEIRFGAELGIQPHLGDLLHAWIRQHSEKGCALDFLIGSTHLVDRLDPYYPDFWTSRSQEEAIRRFLDITLENIRAFDGFDVYGHLDYICLLYTSKSNKRKRLWSKTQPTNQGQPRV